VEVSELKAKAIAEIDRRRDEIVGISCRIHANPELAFQEHQAAEWLSGWLEANGFEVERGIADLPTAFRATLRGSGEGPAIAILGEYDALPKIGHACGHNIIGTAAAAAAIALRPLMDQLPGRVIVLGTPAEESGGGKIIMIERGAFAGIDAAMMVHPGNSHRVANRALASVMMDVEFVGKAAHAASRPEEGINALDGLILSYNNINALRQHIRSDSRIHGIITHGGEAANVVPSFAAGRFMVRAADDDYLDVLLAKVTQCFEAGAQGSGASVSYRMLETRYASLRTNASLARAFLENLVALGISVEPPEAGSMRGIGSTDMGNVSHVMPAIHPTVAITTEEVLGHSPEFAAAAVGEQGQHGLLLAAKAMAMTAIDLLSDAELISRAREEFGASVAAEGSVRQGRGAPASEEPVSG